MKRTDPLAIGDFLSRNGLTKQSLQDAAQAKAAYHRMTPALRFDLQEREAFDMLMDFYQTEVLDRHMEFISDDNVTTVIAETVMHMVQMFPSPGLLLCGSTGNGKTTLAKAFKRMCQRLDSTGHFKYMGEYFKFESRFLKGLEICDIASSKSEDDFNELKNIPLLVIDDTGEEPREVLDYGNVSHPVRRLIEDRYERLKFTILTTNLVPDDIKAQYGLRVFDRLEELYLKIIFRGTSYRLKAKRFESPKPELNQ